MDIKSAASNATSAKYTLIAKDGERFEVEKEVALMSGFVKSWIKDNRPETDELFHFDIPLPNVRACVLTKSIEFCQQHTKDPMKEIPRPLLSADLAEVLSEWYVRFVEMDQELLFEVVRAAHDMDIKPLLDLGCAKVAAMTRELAMQ